MFGACTVGTALYLVDCEAGQWTVRTAVVTRDLGTQLRIAQGGMSLTVDRETIWDLYGDTVEAAWAAAERRLAAKLAAVRAAHAAWLRTI